MPESAMKDGDVRKFTRQIVESAHDHALVNDSRFEVEVERAVREIAAAAIGGLPAAPDGQAMLPAGVTVGAVRAAVSMLREALLRYTGAEMVTDWGMEESEDIGGSAREALARTQAIAAALAEAREGSAK